MCLCLFALAGCTKANPSLSVDKGDEPVISSQPVSDERQVNPLTGLKDIESDKISRRPVSVMINNLNIAQPVQTGLSQADIVYETEVEGGITRLLAVYQDITAVDRVGTIRSARYAFVDLAMGHNSIYIHCGADPTYCTPHLKDLDDISVSAEKYATRISNGLATEHTLYAYGDTLWKGLSGAGWKTAATSTKSWQNFADEAAPVTLPETASNVCVAFSSNIKSSFAYNAESGKYTRSFNDTVRKDYVSGDKMEFKNVFVLTTKITDYPDGYHRKIDLTGGEGYYIVNGTSTEIKWSKGSASSPIVFTNTDGSELTVNPGNSWVCIANKSASITFN